MVDNYAAFFNCTPVGRGSDFMMDTTYFHFGWLGPELLVCCLVHRGSIVVFFPLIRIFSKIFGAPGPPSSNNLLNL